MQVKCIIIHTCAIALLITKRLGKSSNAEVAKSFILFDLFLRKHREQIHLIHFSAIKTTLYLPTAYGLRRTQYAIQTISKCFSENNTFTLTKEITPTAMSFITFSIFNINVTDFCAFTFSRSTLFLENACHDLTKEYYEADMLDQFQ